MRASVKRMLAASPAFTELPADQQRTIARDMTRVARFIVAGPRGDTVPSTATVATELVNEVDFPGFVAALIQGVFQAIVNASIEQMAAYSDLLKDATKEIDAYSDNTDDDDDKHQPAVANRRRLHANRQQLLATMVLMGINRIVVTDGVIKARVRFKVEPDPPPTG